jgi:hypothetical protein
MRTGDRRILGTLRADVWQRVIPTITVSSSVTSVTIPDLHGDTDEMWLLRCRFIAGYAGTVNYRLTFNGDTGANYGSQYIRGSSTGVSAGRGTSDTSVNIGWTLSSTGKIGKGECLIHAKSGTVRSLIVNRVADIYGTTVDTIDMQGCVWNNSVNEITTVTVFASQTGGIGPGSTIELYRRLPPL